MPVINMAYHSSQRQFDPQALVVLGPQISVDILPPSIVESWAKSHNVNVKSATSQSALLDSGASITGADENLLADLQYPPIGIANLSTPSGISRTQVYMVKLIVPSTADPNFPPNIPRIIFDNVRVISVKLGNQRYKVLLGRDIISQTVMVYNGPHALVTLGY
ncbi:MAG: hypothetical protein QXR06_00990 [Candidatus Bathyarchaeia archaeon]|nr:hypothetical protein [Candidatus Bathyarchaeota archaeon]